MLVARTPEPERRRQRREDVTSAAAALFAERGFARTTTAEVARAAGISTGNLFYYFRDKRAIFRAIFEQDIPMSRALFEAHVDTAEPLTSILDVVTALAAPAREEVAPGLMVELLRQVGEDPQLLEVVGANEAIVQNGLADLIRRAAEANLVDGELDEQEAARWIRTIVDAVYLNAGHAPGADPLPMLRLVVTRFLRTARENDEHHTC